MSTTKRKQRLTPIAEEEEAAMTDLPPSRSTRSRTRREAAQALPPPSPEPSKPSTKTRKRSAEDADKTASNGPRKRRATAKGKKAMAEKGQDKDNARPQPKRGRPPTISEDVVLEKAKRALEKGHAPPDEGSAEGVDTENNVTGEDDDAEGEAGQEVEDGAQQEPVEDAPDPATADSNGVDRQDQAPPATSDQLTRKPGRPKKNVAKPTYEERMNENSTGSDDDDGAEGSENQDEDGLESATSLATTHEKYSVNLKSKSVQQIFTRMSKRGWTGKENWVKHVQKFQDELQKGKGSAKTPPSAASRNLCKVLAELSEVYNQAPRPVDREDTDDLDFRPQNAYLHSKSLALNRLYLKISKHVGEICDDGLYRVQDDHELQNTEKMERRRLVKALCIYVIPTLVYTLRAAYILRGVAEEETVDDEGEVVNIELLKESQFTSSSLKIVGRLVDWLLELEEALVNELKLNLRLNPARATGDEKFTRDMQTEYKSRLDLQTELAQLGVALNKAEEKARRQRRLEIEEVRHQRWLEKEEARRQRRVEMEAEERQATKQRDRERKAQLERRYNAFYTSIQSFSSQSGAGGRRVMEGVGSRHHRSFVPRPSVARLTQDVDRMAIDDPFAEDEEYGYESARPFTEEENDMLLEELRKNANADLRKLATRMDRQYSEVVPQVEVLKKSMRDIVEKRGLGKMPIWTRKQPLQQV